MEKPTNDERIRKAYASKGTRSQKHVSFRIDLDNLERLQEVPNKGRLINEAIRTYLEKQ